jgi:hypothetical protein
MAVYDPIQNKKGALYHRNRKITFLFLLVFLMGLFLTGLGIGIRQRDTILHLRQHEFNGILARLTEEYK